MTATEPTSCSQPSPDGYGACELSPGHDGAHWSLVPDDVFARLATLEAVLTAARAYVNLGPDGHFSDLRDAVRAADGVPSQDGNDNKDGG